MNGIKIKDNRPKTNKVAIGSLPCEQVFQFDDGGFGMLIGYDAVRCLVKYYSFGAHRIDFLINSTEVTPVSATLVIESGGVQP